MTYQERAYATAKYGDNLEYPFIALAEEAGEVLGKLGKYLRKNNVSISDAIQAAAMPILNQETSLRDDLIKELGDLRWNLAACCTELGITEKELEDVNLDKLHGRTVRLTICGSGDDR